MTSKGRSTERGPLTIAQIAERAGVSVATVSKVVNGRAVAGETRDLVEDVIKEWGYRRQRRVTAPAPLVELVFNVLGGDYAMEIIVGAERAARQHHLAVMVSGLEGRQAPSRGWVDELVSRRPTGVLWVFCSPTVSQVKLFRSRHIPFVMVDPLAEPGPQFPSVSVNNWNAGLSATRHLLELGHRRIGLIAGPTHALASRARLDGYRAALDAAGVPIDPGLIRQGDFQISSGVENARHLLGLPNPPTAIFASSDRDAIGIYQVAYELGIRIPKDLSVVGFDDIPPASWLTPPLTTVRQPLADMAGAAVDLVVDLARGKQPSRREATFSADLMVRGSTGAPRTA
ncbi:LacI family DNA-binding transcriptional regulator [Luedemannella flava]|uniref:LacI family DNA-binding transcriptional regulator n=1 Tax=Luedemannella flava TaxID=349316 RepID=UPI0031D81640